MTWSTVITIHWKYSLAVPLVLSFMVFPTQLLGNDIRIQEIQERNQPKEIGHAYDSWSLFLVCNSTWLLDENEEKLADLYRQFKAFGEAIGRKHLAVWFWKGNIGINKPITRNVDAERCSYYCSKFKLLPSEGPYILVTTTYPEVDTDIANYFVLKLNNCKSSDISALLNKLSDQLLVEGLNQTALDSEQYWRTIQRAFEVIRGNFVNFFKKVKVKLTIDTKFFKIEIDGGENQ